MKPTPLDQAKKALLAKAKPETPLGDADFVSTGLTLLNKATYGRTFGGLAKGFVYRLAGHSQSGKTFVARTILAEAAINPGFKDYELVYDDVEVGALMDTAKFFPQLVKRMTPPARSAKTKDPIYSRSIGDFYRRLRERLEKGRRLIWVEDSMDALVPETETKMTDGKAKLNSQELRKLIEPLRATGSILILVSQAHVNMRSLFGGELAAGGRALEFYSTLDIWLHRVKSLKVTYKGGKYATGSLIAARVKKNRMSGQDRTVYFPFYPDYGVDDLGSCVDYLIRTKHWPKSAAGVTAKELKYEGDRRGLIAHVEGEGLQRELQVIVGRVWDQIHEAVTVKRLPRYS